MFDIHGDKQKYLIYWDKNGKHHIPIKERHDAFYYFTSQFTVASDRLRQEDTKKHDELLKKYFGDAGQYWSYREFDKIEKWLSDFIGKPVSLQYMQQVDTTDGYAYWVFHYNLKMYDNNKALMADIGSDGIGRNRCPHMMYSLTPHVNLEEVKVGKRFQFAGDKDWVREVKVVDGEFCMVETKGSLEEPKYYKCHYSYLYPNNTRLSYLKNEDE